METEFRLLFRRAGGESKKSASEKKELGPLYLRAELRIVSSIYYDIPRLDLDATCQGIRNYIADSSSRFN